MDWTIAVVLLAVSKFSIVDLGFGTKPSQVTSWIGSSLLGLGLLLSSTKLLAQLVRRTSMGSSGSSCGTIKSAGSMGLEPAQPMAGCHKCSAVAEGCTEAASKLP